MTTMNDIGRQFAGQLNRDYERKKKTVTKLVRLGWGVFTYFKGPPQVEGDLTKVNPETAIAALSKQVQSGLQDQKLDVAAMEFADLVTGWIMDLLRPSDNTLEAQLAMIGMARGCIDPYPQYPQQNQAPSPSPSLSPPQNYTPRPVINPSPRPMPRPNNNRRPRRWGGRMANDDGQWVYLANDGGDDAANDGEDYQ
jgi:hypothetical protein